MAGTPTNSELRQWARQPENRPPQSWYDATDNPFEPFESSTEAVPIRQPAVAIILWYGFVGSCIGYTIGYTIGSLVGFGLQLFE